MGKSNLRKTDREQPEGERRMWNLDEYIPELRTEQRSRLRRKGIRYRAGVIHFTCGGRKCEFPVNLGGNAGPGSRPKRTGTGDFVYIPGGTENDSLGRIKSTWPDCPGDG